MDVADIDIEDVLKAAPGNAHLRFDTCEYLVALFHWHLKDPHFRGDKPAVPLQIDDEDHAVIIAACAHAATVMAKAATRDCELGYF